MDDHSTEIAATKSVGPRPWSAAESLFAAAWAILGAGVCAMLWLLSDVWGSRAEYGDRFLIPIVCVWAAYENHERFRRAGGRPTTLGLLLLVPAAALFAIGWWLQAQAGARTLLLFWMAGSLQLAAFGLLLLQFGRRHAWVMAFPIIYFLFALPNPTVLDRFQPPLQEAATRLSHFALGLAGFSAERQGFVLVLPGGELGVIEACSGIRSVTALTAIAILVAFVRGFSLWQGAGLVAVTLPIVVVANSVRITLTGILQETVGRSAIEGFAHEALGMGVVLVGLALVVSASQLFRPAAEPAAGPGPEPAAGRRAGTAGAAAALLALVPACAMCIWWGVELSPPAHSAALSQVPFQIADWKGEDLPIPPAVNEALNFRSGLHRVYRNATGREIHVWVLFWPATEFRGGPHDPDVCWPNRGWSVGESGERRVTPTGRQTAVPVTTRRYLRSGQEQVLYYWTQDGARVLPVSTVGEPAYAWLNDAFAGRKIHARTTRLFVLTASEAWGRHDRTEEALQGFCSQLAAELYRLCPWAAPGGDEQ